MRTTIAKSLLVLHLVSACGHTSPTSSEVLASGTLSGDWTDLTIPDQDLEAIWKESVKEGKPVTIGPDWTWKIHGGYGQRYEGIQQYSNFSPAPTVTMRLNHGPTINAGIWDGFMMSKTLLPKETLADLSGLKLSVNVLIAVRAENATRSLLRVTCNESGSDAIPNNLSFIDNNWSDWREHRFGIQVLAVDVAKCNSDLIVQHNLYGRRYQFVSLHYQIMRRD